jgi:N-acetylneuraminic acid mutarotase
MSKRIPAAAAMALSLLSAGCGTSPGAIDPNAVGKPAIQSFSASPSSIVAGADSVLSWSVTGATGLSIDQGVGTVTGTSASVAPAATTTYTLTATSATGSATATAAVAVTPTLAAPGIRSFGATPSTMAAGGSATLSWDVVGATSLSIAPGVGTVTGSSAVVSPAATTTYTLTANNATGSATATATVTVQAVPTVPVISSFTATPGNIKPGTASTLAWSVTGATSLSIDQAIGAVTGSSTPVTPAATTTYTLTATNGAGSNTGTATVTVSSVASLALNCGTVAAGSTLTLTASLVAAAGTPAREVDWSVPPSSAGTVSPARGITTDYTAPGAAGSYPVDGQSVWDPTKTASCTVTVVPASNSLTQKRDMPTTRIFHAAAALNGRIYVFGGRLDPSKISPEPSIHAYDPATDLWSTPAAPLPTPRESAAAVAVGGKFYVIGGFAGGVSTAVEAYDPVANTWATRAPLLAPRMLHAAAAVNGRIYVMGGAASQSGGPVATVEEYDPVANTWTARAPMPTARGSLGAAVVGGKIYAVAGSVSATSLRAVEVYDPTANQWTTGPSISIARSDFGLATGANGKIYAFGGAGTPSSSFDSIEEFDPVAGAWATRGPLVPARYSMPAVAAGAGIYLMGGYLQIAAGGPTARTDLYTPP